jgi:hypothetical protein
MIAAQLSDLCQILLVLKGKDPAKEELGDMGNRAEAIACFVYQTWSTAILPTIFYVFSPFYFLLPKI